MKMNGKETDKQEQMQMSRKHEVKAVMAVPVQKIGAPALFSWSDLPRIASLRLCRLFSSLVSGRSLRQGNELLMACSSFGQISSDVAPVSVTSFVMFVGWLAK